SCTATNVTTTRTFTRHSRSNASTPPHALHSFPTRRSSDLTVEVLDTNGALGAAIGAGIGTGHFQSRAEAFKNIDKITTLRPDPRSEEHTSELQSRFDLVCRLLLEKKKTSVIADTEMPRRER